ncbi:HaeII family restriction endonuclease [bacterium]|nr:HaeII family restriction endonuclease [bacterium]
MVKEETTFCREKINKMLKRSQSKSIYSLITLGIVDSYVKTGQDICSDKDIRQWYYEAIKQMKRFLGHDLHMGGKYNDSYPTRISKYSVLKVLDVKKYQLTEPFKKEAKELIKWIPEAVAQYIAKKLTIIPQLGEKKFRSVVSSSARKFAELIENNIDVNPINFEIFSFAILKVHLEKFACRIYRDTRTSAHDKGVDISTNFGVVYQIKKIKLTNQKIAKGVYDELKSNFDNDRLEDGKVIIVIDDIAKPVKEYLIDMKIQSLSKRYLLDLAGQFDCDEDREKVLRVIFEEFSREYSSDI